MRPLHTVGELGIADRRLRQAPVTAQQPLQILAVRGTELAFARLRKHLHASLVGPSYVLTK